MLYKYGMAAKRKEPWGSVSEKLVAFRLPVETLRETDRLKGVVGEPGKPASRSRVIREALRIGLRTLARREQKRGGA